MRRLILFVFSLLLLPAAVQAEFIEGTHYRKLAQAQPVKTGNKIEVREFFWYGCPHCYNLEPYIKKWLKKKPANVEFVLTPGTAPRWIVHAKTFYALEALGVRDKLHSAFFEAIHKQRRPLNTESSIAAFVAENGVDKDAFLKAYQSFGVHLKVEQAKATVKSYAVSSVPTLVVDGRYVTSPHMAGGNTQVTLLLDQLIKESKRERKRPSAKR